MRIGARCCESERCSSRLGARGYGGDDTDASSRRANLHVRGWMCLRGRRVRMAAARPGRSRWTGSRPRSAGRHRQRDVPQSASRAVERGIGCESCADHRPSRKMDRARGDDRIREIESTVLVRPRVIRERARPTRRPSRTNVPNRARKAHRWDENHGRAALSLLAAAYARA
jgi:hypothetical protein